MEKLEQLIEKYKQDYPFSGQIVIAKKEKIIARFGYGYRDFATKESFLAPQIFPIASISKQVTAVGILKMTEHGKLDLNKHISYYLPNGHALWDGNMPLWASEITLHQLLIQASGLPNYCVHAANNQEQWIFLNKVSANELHKAIISKIKSEPLIFIPGSKFDYNNTNYLLLDVILAEFVPNHDLSMFYTQEIFKPLGLNNTIYPDLKEELEYVYNIYANSKLPRRYLVNYQNQTVIPQLVNSHDFNVPCGGAGGIFSTIEDLIRWNYALNNDELLKPETLNLMYKIHIKTNSDPYMANIAYGYGMMVENIKNQPIYYHPGGFLGVSTNLSYNPQSQVGVAILSNFSPLKSEDVGTRINNNMALINLMFDIHRSNTI